MIQDFSSVFEGKQAVRVKAVSYREHSVFRKTAGIVVAGALIIGVVSCVVFGLLIKSGLKELDEKQTVKLELIKKQRELYEQRTALLEKDKVELVAASMGLYSPYEKQVRRL